MDNVNERVEEQIILLDDALSYTTQARSREEHDVMVRVFRKAAAKHLDYLIDWAFSLKTFREQEHRIIFVADAMIKMRKDFKTAKQLMDKLHAEPLSLKHYALFVRHQYDAVTRALAVVVRKKPVKKV